uniref:transposase zinc-binding domain-containing protein n=1 Tax=Paenibacillus agricola TaxID=2716264 RepID=UPI002441C766|nr:transposase zinc-binding domain-containing protein [Paenibacillus agricola]
MEANILKQIFFDKHRHWDAFVEKHKAQLRPNIKEVQKFRGCGDPRNGFKIVVCEGCHDNRRIPYRCKGRFCTTCSYGETEEWSRLLVEDVFQVNHPHVHMLVTMGGMKANGEWKTYDYIPFEMLRKQWQTVVLKLIRASLNAEDKKQVQSRLQKAYSANGECARAEAKGECVGTTGVHWQIYETASACAKEDQRV